MGNTVYAEGMGFFHKGSGGKGVAPGDACLSPPTPPAGPLPVPYVNMLQASDLANGSKSVKIQGEPTALEDASYVSTSTGNEAGTQGGGVVTHKTKGKGSFKLWSFVVKVEGKGVDRHGDTMEQNTASPLPNCIDAAAAVNFLKTLTTEMLEKDCPEPYKGKKHRQSTTEGQRESVQEQACWQCVEELTTATGARQAELTKKIAAQKAEGPPRLIADHQPPENVAWEMGGCHLKPSPEAFKKAMKDLYVKPHCQSHSSSQGGQMRGLDTRDIFDFMNESVDGLAI